MGGPCGQLRRERPRRARPKVGRGGATAHSSQRATSTISAPPRGADSTLLYSARHAPGSWLCDALETRRRRRRSGRANPTHIADLAACKPSGPAYPWHVLESAWGFATAALASGLLGLFGAMPTAGLALGCNPLRAMCERLQPCASRLQPHVRRRAARRGPRRLGKAARRARHRRGLLPRLGRRPACCDLPARSAGRGGQFGGGHGSRACEYCRVFGVGAPLRATAASNERGCSLRHLAIRLQPPAPAVAGAPLLPLFWAGGLLCTLAVPVLVALVCALSPVASQVGHLPQ